MKVIEKYNDSLHNPYWKYQLGPESYEVKDTPQRVEKIKQALRNDSSFEFCTAHSFPERLLAQFHPYHDYIRKTSERLSDDEEFYPDLFPGDGAQLPRRVDSMLWGGLWCTDAVTPIKKQTYEVARASAETALTGAELLRDGKATAVYALCRPSGHHAGPRVFGGYCYFNNAATAAQYLLSVGPVAIVDIDYHHGNGTQEFFEENKSVFTASIHADPSDEYPYFWGYADECGKGQGIGSNLNKPLPKGSDIDRYLKALDHVLSAVRAFAPAQLILSAGFDTHASDPIGGFQLQTPDYGMIGARFGDLGIPTLVCQEGGYDVNILGENVRSFLKGLVDEG